MKKIQNKIIKKKTKSSKTRGEQFFQFLCWGLPVLILLCPFASLILDDIIILRMMIISMFYWLIFPFDAFLKLRKRNFLWVGLCICLVFFTYFIYSYHSYRSTWSKYSDSIPIAMCMVWPDCPNPQECEPYISRTCVDSINPKASDVTIKSYLKLLINLY